MRTVWSTDEISRNDDEVSTEALYKVAEDFICA